jgi:hypothetical protein
MQDNRYSVNPDQLTDEQLDNVSGGNNGAEMSMIQLQSVVSQRARVLQLTTGMINSINSSSKTIAGNIKP